jgi:hypothetical protein
MHTQIAFVLTTCATLAFITGCSDDPPKTACDHDISGQAKSVEFIIHNAASTPRYYATKCDSPFHLQSPAFGYAPGNPGALMCDTAPSSCDTSCTDVGFIPFAPKTSQSFLWDGVLYGTVDAAQEGCAAANAGTGCFSTCVRKRDGDEGEYKVTLRVYEEDLTLTEYKTTFVYPKQTTIMVDIP